MHLIPTRQAKISTHSQGKGPVVIFLHGGPGDTHHYMKKMAQPLTQDFQCIFFDQRGTGGSRVENRIPENFKLEFLLEDLEAIQKYYQTGPCAIVGHSWGAMYGLFACMKNSKQFTKAALLNMGPLDSETGKKNSQHLLSVLNEKEKQLWSELRKRRNQARDSGYLALVQQADREMMFLRVKAWIYDPQLHKTFLNDYFQDPPPDRDVNKWIWESLEGWFSWDHVSSNITTETWLLAGANDANPVSQAERLQSVLPNSRLSIYDKCGHIPWLEHPGRFYSDLISFLKS